MNLRLIIDGRRVDVELNQNGDVCRFRLRSEQGENDEKTASLREVEPGTYSVLLDGRSYEVRLEPGRQVTFAVVRDRRFAVEVEDPRRSRQRAVGGFGEGRQSVTAPMPGKVMRLLVCEGDPVEAGQGLVVVEAMKMQNEMKAPRAGRVATLAAREGAAVAAGEVLVTIE
jgi:biotin carboxyl carrier protein